MTHKTVEITPENTICNVSSKMKFELPSEGLTNEFLDWFGLCRIVYNLLIMTLWRDKTLTEDSAKIIETETNKKRQIDV